MTGVDIPGEIIGLVIAACLGFFVLALYSDLSTSSLVIEQGKPFYETQRDFLPSLAELIPLLVGGTGLAVTALWIFANAGGR